MFTLRKSAGLAAALEGVDELVISLAFPGLPVEQPKKGLTFMDVDAGGTQQLIAAGQQAGVRRVVYLSGAGAGHDAERHWFRAKAVAEDAVRGSGMAWTILRPTWVYGPGDVSLNRFLGFARFPCHALLLGDAILGRFFLGLDPRARLGFLKVSFVGSHQRQEG